MRENDQDLTAAQKDAARNALTAQRKILITGEIDESTAVDFIGQLAALQNAHDTKPITVIVDSFGGSVHSANAIVSAMLESTAPVNTVCHGKAMSAGFFIYIAGKERRCSDWATFLAHSTAFSFGLKKTPDIINQIESCKARYRQVSAWFGKRTKMPAKFWMDIFEGGKDTFFTAEEAREMGITNA